MTWSVEAVESLAPDAASVRAGQKLASPGPWSETGHDERLVWGLCQGSGKQPYQAQVDLQGPAFKCSCPSRKFPCKHCLGLMLLWAAGGVAAGDPPDWVREWLATREEQVERASRRAESTPDPEAAARRAAAREERVAAGIEDLRLWLGDVARGGLAAAQSQPYAFWDGFAARLVDAQAPGLARRVRPLAGIAMARQPNWPERMLDQLGMLYLLCEAQGRAEGPLAAEVRSLVGWTTGREEVLAGPRVRDRWAVLAREIDEQDELRVQRTWLWGLDAGRPALVLDFAPAGAPLDPGLPLGMALDGELAFYPGELRALVAGDGPLEPVREPFGHDGAEAALAAAAEAVVASPWTDRWPIALAAAVPDAPGDEPRLHAADGSLPLDGSRRRLWRLASLAAGHEVSVLGVWNGRVLNPLAAGHEGRVVAL